MKDETVLNRRSFIAGAGAAVAATAALGCGAATSGEVDTDSRSAGAPVAVDGQREGIASRPFGHLQLAAFDLQRDSTLELHELLRRWGTLAHELMVEDRVVRRASPPPDLGLTITFGLGPTLFLLRNRDRLGLARRRPRELAPLPAFAGDAIEPTYSGGDLCVQICSDDQQVVYDALHTLTRTAAGVAAPRWVQTGFVADGRGTPRNLMGFKDGTNSIDPHDDRALAEHVWVGGDDTPTWMRGGSYMIVRRIRMLLDVWDATSVQEQEATIGRRKTSGAPLGARNEHARVDLAATTPDGAPVIPADAHIRLAAASTNRGVRILRRGYNYAGDVDHATGQRDVGLIFISFQRDPRQFIALQQRLAQHDALSKHILHTGSAIFACPPLTSRRGPAGDSLFA